MLHRLFVMPYDSCDIAERGRWWDFYGTKGGDGEDRDRAWVGLGDVDDDSFLISLFHKNLMMLNHCCNDFVSYIVSDGITESPVTILEFTSLSIR